MAAGVVVSDAAACELADVVRTNRALHSLTLYSAQLAGQRARVLCSALAANDTIRVLDLNGMRAYRRQPSCISSRFSLGRYC